jgi:CPA2 family monovalent cation:H+ antiporter-2
MHDAHEFLRNLALVLCVAAITTVVFKRLRQPVIFGYLLAGMIVGPHVPIPLVADEGIVETLSELGVILLLFSLGLEFSLRKLLQIGPTAGLVAVPETSGMVFIGYVVGQLFGWTTLESVFAGAIIAISSTTIIAKAFDEQRVKGKFTDIVFGVLIIEDLIGIFLIAILTAVSAGAGVSASSLAVTGARLATFLAGLIGVGLLLIPRFMRVVVRMNQPETTLVASIGICFAAAWLALSFGYSVALGAFIAGSLVAESGEEKVVEHLIRPVRDMFAAIFFVAVGILIDPAIILQHWGAVLSLAAVVIAGKVLFVSTSSFLTGNSVRTSVQAGMSLAQIGEFSFIIAAVGLSSGATRDFLYPVAVAVSAITTLTTPWLIRSAAPAARWADRRLPAPLQTFASLYGSWIERMRRSPGGGASRSTTRRLVRLLLIDAVLIAAVVVGAALEAGRVSALLRQGTGIAEGPARAIVLAAAAVVGLPLLIGLTRTARRLGLELAHKALPAAGKGKVDFAAAPRRALVVTLQLAILAAVGVPLVAVTLPFLPSYRFALLPLVLVAIPAIAFWRSTMNLQGHAKAGAEVIAMKLGAQMAAAADAKDESLQIDMQRVRAALPGLGEPVSLRVPADSAATERTLAELNLRGVTGATVLAIVRRGETALLPSGHERVHAGDVLAVAGSEEAIAAARELLEPSAPDVATPI